MPKVNKGSQLQKDWERLKGLNDWQAGKQIIDWEEGQRAKSADGGQLEPVATYQHGMLTCLFEQPPQMDHMIQELLVNPNSINFYKTHSLMHKKELDVADLLLRFTVPSSKPYRPEHKPITALQKKVFANSRGLRQCGPIKLNVDMFPMFHLSPNMFFKEEQNLLVNNAGTHSTVHINVGITLGFSMVVAGLKLFVLFGTTKHNHWSMQRYHRQVLTWSDTLNLMSQLEEPSFNI